MNKNSQASPDLQKKITDLIQDISTKCKNGEYIYRGVNEMHEGVITKIRFHDLRATWAILLLRKGVESIKVMLMGGWRDIRPCKTISARRVWTLRWPTMDYL